MRLYRLFFRSRLSLLVLSAICVVVFLTGINIYKNLFVQAQSAPVELWRGGELVSAYSTIQAGINGAQAGDIVRVRGGHYYENLTISGKSGTESLPITLEGAPGETVIIDGAHQALTVPNNLWQPRPEIGAGVYSIANFPFLSQTTGADSYTYAYMSDGTMLWTYSTMAYFGENFSGQGIYPDRATNSIYIKLDGNINPNTIPLYIGKSVVAHITNGSSHWKFQNLTFQHGTYGVIFIRDGSNGMEFRNVTVRNGRTGILQWGNGDTFKIHESTFAMQWNFTDWWWTDVKQKFPKTMEGHAVGLEGVTNADIYNNTASGYFNGIKVRGVNNKIHDNVIHDIMDDGIEVEHDNQNLQVYNNFVYDTYVGIAMTPFYPGPAYVYRNTIAANLEINFDHSANPPTLAKGRGIKLGADDSGNPSENVKVYQNTFYCLGNCKTGGTPQGTLQNPWEWYNNIFYSVNTNPALNMSDTELQGHIFQRNLWYPGKETVDITGIVSNPLFVNPSGNPPDLHVASGSTARNAGNILPQQKGWPDSAVVTDGMPDIGAVEYLLAPTPTSTPIPTPTSTPSPTPLPTETPMPTLTPTPVQTTVTLNPVADSYVVSNKAKNNYGTQTTLVIDSNPITITYLKFDLNQLAGKTIVSANLRLKVSNTSAGNGRVKSVNNTSWGETSVNYNNRPSFGSQLGTLPANVATGNWATLLITNYIASNSGGLVSIGVDSGSTDDYVFYSREHMTSTNQPQLVVTYY